MNDPRPYRAVCEDCRTASRPLYLRRLHHPEQERDRAAKSVRVVIARGLCNDCWAVREQVQR